MGFNLLYLERNPWLGSYCPQIPILSDLCPQLNFLTDTPPPPLEKIPGYATDIQIFLYAHNIFTGVFVTQLSSDATISV
jgi:hypothetical protein